MRDGTPRGTGERVRDAHATFQVSMKCLCSLYLDSDREQKGPRREHWRIEEGHPDERQDCRSYLFFSPRLLRMSVVTVLKKSKYSSSLKLILSILPASRAIL